MTTAPEPASIASAPARPVLTIPGIHGSGPLHWQSLWETKCARVRRIPQRDWGRPVMQAWMEGIDAAVAESHVLPVLVAHSLGCLAAAHWCSLSSREVHAVMLVSLPDPEGPNFPRAAESFGPAPDSIGQRACLILASSDDPYSNLNFVSARASRWNAALRILGTHGHLNAESGLGDWDAGWKQLLALDACCQPSLPIV